MKHVPWSSKDEWLNVKAKLGSDNYEEKKRAYQLLLMWKSRCPQLPANIECTLGILQVMIIKKLNQDETLNEEALLCNNTTLQLSYSTALVRFVNHVSSSTSKMGDTLYLAASKQDIPDWVINLRHDIAHSSSLPCSDLLESALQLAYQWLLENYWNVQEEKFISVEGANLKPAAVYFIPGSLEILVVSGVAALWTCNLALKRGAILEGEFKETDRVVLATFASTLESSKITKVLPNMLNLKAVIDKRESNTEIRTIYDKIFKILLAVAKSGNNFGKYLLKGIINNGFLADKGENLETWGTLIRLLDKYDSLQGLLEYLFEKVVSDDDEEKRSALGWLEALAPVMDRMRHRWNLLGPGDNKVVTENGLRLRSETPPRIRLEVIKSAILKLDYSLLKILPKFIILSSPPLSKDTRMVLEELMRIYVYDPFIDSSVNEHPLEIHSVEDIPIDKTQLPIKEIVIPNDFVNKSPWKIVPIDAEVWRKCPIGLLPHQVSCDLEMPNLSWHKVSQNRKRKLSI